jgi:hypothetical protein
MSEKKWFSKFGYKFDCLYRYFKDEGRRRWIASITRKELVRAGAEFCRKTLKELREEMSGNEDGRMVYRGKQDTPLLDLVRAGFLRSIVTPGGAVQVECSLLIARKRLVSTFKPIK